MKLTSFYRKAENNLGTIVAFHNRDGKRTVEVDDLGEFPMLLA